MNSARIRSSVLLAVALPLFSGGTNGQRARWDAVVVPVRPAGILEPALAQDRARNEIVQFGGIDLQVGGTVRDETWLWSGSAWRQVTPVVRPTARARAALTDLPGGGVLLFGGSEWQVGGEPLRDTWSWDGIEWREIPTSTRPERVVFPLLVTDRTHGDVFLIERSGAQSRSRVWRWIDSDWQPQTSSPQPWGIFQATFDDHSGRLVVQAYGSDNREGLWYWDGAVWTAIPAPPIAGWPFGLAADSSHGALISIRAIGLGSTEALTMAWVDDGWVQVDASPGVATYYRDSTLIQEPDTGRVLYIPWTASSDYYRLDLVPTGVDAEVEYHGSGCPGSVGVSGLHPVSDSLPRLGETFRCEVRPLPTSRLLLSWGLIGLSDRTHFSGSPLPQNLSFLGLSGCMLRVSSELDQRLPKQLDTAVWEIPIPHLRDFEGVELFLQAIHMDPSGNPAGLVLSDSARLRLGF